MFNMGYNEPINPKGNIMKPNEIKAAINTAVVATVGVVAVTSYINIHRTEAKKRRNLKTNMVLDIQAIEAARDRMSKRIANGDYPIGSLTQLQRDMQTEIEFQKIAIREDRS